MKILSATADAAEWDSLINSLPPIMQDVHFTSAYARVQEAGVFGEGRAVLAVAEYSDSFTAQAFLMQPIPNTELFDIKSLYGYGGPIRRPSKPDAIQISAGQVFKEELTAWARHNGIVSEYCCLHPLLARHQLPLLRGDNVMFTKEVVVIDLVNFDESKVERRVRKTIKNARPKCIGIEVPFDAKTFGELYNLSMDRLGAHPRWRYGRAYWNAHLDELGSWAKFIYLIEHNAGARRGLLVIGSSDTAYAHFLGSDGVGDFDALLYFDTALYLREKGFTRFHLGGGLTCREDDPLLFFKSGFSDQRYRVGSYRRVFQQVIYEQLAAERVKTAKVDHGWFPLYRAPELCAS